MRANLGLRWRMVFCGLLLPLLACAMPLAAALDDTLQGLERLRGPNGLPRDTVLVARDGSLRPAAIVGGLTSPSDIGFDLLVQAELYERPPYRAEASRRIHGALTTLAQLPTQPGSGLFFDAYAVDGIAAAQRDVSSIDNLHLALALWTISQQGGADGAAAKKLFRRMDFSSFVDATRGTLGGNLRFISEGTWLLDSFRYDYFGSETRSLYAVGAAIGIGGLDRSFLEAAVGKLTVEIAAPYGQRLLRTWDGGTFQLFLPEVLIGEHRYSAELARSFSAYGDFAWQEGLRRGLPLPAAHSACVISLDPPSPDPQPASTQITYQGQEGSRAIGNRQGTQVFDDSTVAAHAVLLAATADGTRGVDALDRVAQQTSTLDVPFYRSGLGFVDAARVRERANDAQPLAVVLSLDKELEALALLQMLAPDHLTASARWLQRGERTRDELTRFYRLVDQRLAGTTVVN